MPLTRKMRIINNIKLVLLGISLFILLVTILRVITINNYIESYKDNTNYTKIYNCYVEYCEDNIVILSLEELSFELECYICSDEIIDIPLGEKIDIRTVKTKLSDDKILPITNIYVSGNPEISVRNGKKHLIDKLYDNYLYLFFNLDI